MILNRPARKNVKGKRFQVAGRPLSLRYVVVQLRDGRGKVLAEWMLLTNACQVRAYRTPGSLLLLEVDTALKVISNCSRATASNWNSGSRRPERPSPAACLSRRWPAWWSGNCRHTIRHSVMELRAILIRLSGRQMKRNRPHTAPALLAGLWVLLSMLALLEHYDLDDLRRLAAQIPVFRRT